MNTLSGRLLKDEIYGLYFNLALEEAILSLHHESTYKMTLRLWKNTKSVVLGRNQHIYEEIDERYCNKHDIQIGRRISGGGTVYHDEGNLNISFFIPKNLLTQATDIKSTNEFFTNLIVDSLVQSGIQDVERESHSNILYKGRKISGAAGYRKKNWILHHATLLIDANLEHLEKSLLARERNPTEKRKSRYFPTSNVQNFDRTKWETKIHQLVEDRLGIKLIESQIAANEEEYAKKLEQTAYCMDEWIINKKRTLSQH